jgi:lysine 2,3-aminomutase
VYCRFCTRSYAVGLDTDSVEKVGLRVNRERWEKAFAYVRSRPELEDIVLSGGDVWQLRPEQLKELGETLWPSPTSAAAPGHQGLVMPKILTHDEWIDALTRLVELGRKNFKSVVIHTHFNHANEITAITRRHCRRYTAGASSCATNA